MKIVDSDIKISAKLTAFLTEENLLLEFKNNCVDSLKHIDYAEDFQTEEVFAVVCGFVWADTKEGHAFWELVSERFKLK